MRIVFDSNVLISAVIADGTARKVFDLVRKRNIPWYISPFIAQEVERFFTFGRRQFSGEGKTLLSAVLSESEHIVTPRSKILPQIIREKESDNHILACAEAANADFLVTGDKKHLLPLKRWKKTIIIAPAEFLKILEGL